MLAYKQLIAGRRSRKHGVLRTCEVREHIFVIRQSTEAAQESAVVAAHPVLSHSSLDMIPAHKRQGQVPGMQAGQTLLLHVPRKSRIASCIESLRDCGRIVPESRSQSAVARAHYHDAVWLVSTPVGELTDMKKRQGSELRQGAGQAAVNANSDRGDRPTGVIHGATAFLALIVCSLRSSRCRQHAAGCRQCPA
jgi:hypothetical protein